jgi:hypothetical protein
VDALNNTGVRSMVNCGACARMIEAMRARIERLRRVRLMRVCGKLVCEITMTSKVV